MAHRKNSAAGSIVSTTVTCTSRWLIAKCMRSVVQPRRKTALLAQPRNHSLERDEDQRQDEQVQQEPVEPHGGGAAEAPTLGSRAAEQRAGGGEGDAGEAEDPAAAQDRAQHAQAEAQDEHDVDQERTRSVDEERAPTAS